MDYFAIQQYLAWAGLKSSKDTSALIDHIACMDIKHMDDEYVYFSKLNNTGRKLVSKVGKVWNIPKDFVSDIGLFENISTSSLPFYQGRAKHLSKLLKSTYMVILRYHRSWQEEHLVVEDINLTGISVENKPLVEEDYDKGKGIDRAKYICSKCGTYKLNGKCPFH